MRRRRQTPGVSLHDLDAGEILSLLSAWAPRPGSWTSPRWQSWGDYVATYRDVAAELEASFRDRFRYLRSGEPFGATASRYADEFGLDGLGRANYYEVRAGIAPGSLGDGGGEEVLQPC